MALKRTLLQMVQDILASMEGDEVSSINDTAESRSVTNIIKQCFLQLSSDYKLPEHYNLFNLVETDASTPVLMTKPADAVNIEWLYYKTNNDDTADEKYTLLEYMPFPEFLEMVNNFGFADTGMYGSFTLDTGTGSTLIKYRVDKTPSFYTTYNDSTILFDSYNVEADAFLKSAKTRVYGLSDVSWLSEDSFVPNLDHRLSNLLFQEAKSQAFLELKQVENIKAEKNARRGKLTLQKEKDDIDNQRGYYWSRSLPNYGRN